MISILLTGHGNFAEGVYSAARLIAGESEGVACVAFPETDGTDELRAKLKAALDRLAGEVLILTDLAGGTPFKEAVVLRATTPERRVEVLSGTNVTLVIAALMERDGETLDGLIPAILEEARSGLRQYLPTSPIRTDSGDGI